MPRFAIPLGVFVLMVVLFGAGLRLDPKIVPSPLVEKPAPVFRLTRVKLPDQMLDNQVFTDQVSLFNVWASWCVSCRAEHPLLVGLAPRISIYGLNYKDKREDAVRWLDSYGDPYVASAWDGDGRVGIDWGVYGVPETFVIDRSGVIRYKHIGPLTEQVIEQKILPLIKTLQETQT